MLERSNLSETIMGYLISAQSWKEFGIMFLLTYTVFHVTRKFIKSLEVFSPLSQFPDLISLPIFWLHADKATFRWHFSSFFFFFYKEKSMFSKRQFKVSSSNNRLSEVNRTTWSWLLLPIFCRGRQHHLYHRPGLLNVNWKSLCSLIN